MHKYREEITRRWQAKKDALIAAGNYVEEKSPTYPNFSLVAGTHLLESQILSLKPIIHIFGILIIPNEQTNEMARANIKADIRSASDVAKEIYVEISNLVLPFRPQSSQDGDSCRRNKIPQSTTRVSS